MDTCIHQPFSLQLPPRRINYSIRSSGVFEMLSLQLAPHLLRVCGNGEYRQAKQWLLLLSSSPSEGTALMIAPCKYSILTPPSAMKSGRFVQDASASALRARVIP